MTNLFKGPVDPTKWRPLRPREPGFGSRQYVRKSVSKVTPQTLRLSLRKFQTATGGKTLEERARTNPKGRTEAQREAFQKKRRETAELKKKYGGDVKIGELRKIKKINTAKTI